MIFFAYALLYLSGLPKPVIRWLRNGQELTGNEPGVSILEDGTLLILASLSPLDNGEYVCAAANDAGSTERKYQLKVNGIDLFFLVLSDDFGISFSSSLLCFIYIKNVKIAAFMTSDHV